MARYVVNVLLDKVDTAENINTFVWLTPSYMYTENKCFNVIKKECDKIIIEYEEHSVISENEILDIVDKVNYEFDQRIPSVLYELVNEIMNNMAISDDLIIEDMDMSGCIDGEPSIDVGQLKEEIKDCLKDNTLEWKLRRDYRWSKHFSVSTTENDYFVLINELHEV